MDIILVLEVVDVVVVVLVVDWLEYWYRSILFAPPQYSVELPLQRSTQKGPTVATLALTLKVLPQ